MQLLCIVLLIWQASRAGLAVQGGRVKTETQTQTQSYEKLLQNVRSGIFDDPDNPDPVKTELEAVLDKSRFGKTDTIFFSILVFSWIWDRDKSIKWKLNGKQNKIYGIFVIQNTFMTNWAIIFSSE